MTKSKLLKLSASIAKSLDALGVDDAPYFLEFGGELRYYRAHGIAYNVTPDEAAALLVDWCVREFGLHIAYDGQNAIVTRDTPFARFHSNQPLAAVDKYLKARVKARAK